MNKINTKSFFIDPKIKAKVRRYLAQSNNVNYSDLSDCDLNASLPSSPTSTHSGKGNGSSSGSNSNSNSCGSFQRIGGNTVAAAAAASDPTCRKTSRIPTIIRSPAHGVASSKSCPQSPYGQKVPKLSHIPTAAANGSSNSAPASATICTTEPNKKQRFEAFMMTGDLILNLSRTPQSSGLITTHSKKVKDKSNGNVYSFY